MRNGDENIEENEQTELVSEHELKIAIQRNTKPKPLIETDQWIAIVRKGEKKEGDSIDYMQVGISD